MVMSSRTHRFVDKTELKNINKKKKKSLLLRGARHLLFLLDGKTVYPEITVHFKKMKTCKIILCKIEFSLEKILFQS